MTGGRTATGRRLKVSQPKHFILRQRRRASFDCRNRHGARDDRPILEHNNGCGKDLVFRG